MPSLMADQAARFAPWLPARCRPSYAKNGVGIGCLWLGDVCLEGTLAPDRRRLQCLILATMGNWSITQPTGPRWLKWVTADEFQTMGQADPAQTEPPAAHRDSVIQDIVSTAELCRQDTRNQR